MTRIDTEYPFAHVVINRFLIGGEDMRQRIRRELGRRPIYINE